jgi:predicted CopG family antitoxin
MEGGHAVKTIGIRDETYRRLFVIKVKLEGERNRRVTFSEIIDELIAGKKHEN